MGVPQQDDAMLSGLSSVGDSMFAGLGSPDKYKLVPDPNEMRARMDAAQVVRRADLKCVMVRSYDLSEEKDALQYCKDREWILMGMAMSTHRLVHHDKQFVEGMNPPRWIAHMEWMEFELTETPVAPVGSEQE
jgi:hypothetical protein